jgi:hypothetical protein
VSEPVQVIFWPLRPIGRGNRERRDELVTRHIVADAWDPYNRYCNAKHRGRRGAQKYRYKQHRRK